MANMWSLWEDYEKRYNTWLKNSAVPATQSWYEGTGLEQKLQTGKEYLWGKEPTDVPGLPIQQTGTEGLLGVQGQKPSFRGLQQSRTGQAISATPEQIKKGFVGHPIGYGEGKVDPGLAAGVKSQYGIAQKAFDVKGRVGGEWTKTGIDLYNNVAERVASKFAIRDKNGKIVYSPDGKIELSNEGKNAVNNAITQSGSDLPPQLGGSSTLEQAKAFTEQDANSLSKFAGVNWGDVKKNWAKKGGMDGLMANPAFTLGLALMQSSSQGKRVGSGILDDFVKAAGLSEHYKDRLKSRRNLMGPVSDDQRALAARGLPSNISSPGKIESVFYSTKDKNKLRGHEAALDKIYTNVFMRRSSEEGWDYSKGMQQISVAEFSKEYQKLVASGDIKVVEGATVVYLSTGTIADAGQKAGFEKVMKSTVDWLKKKHKDWFMESKAEGGPVQAGQPYVVGEKGPEVIIPKANANVVSNDDAQVMGMLLASNPQLQNVSKTRAESILRSRFPDYFA